MLQCGLLGEKLKHSYSPMIHAQLADYAYRLYERAPEELDLFLCSAEWDGLNVTIPYKKTVVPYCDVLSPQARQLGSVNTLVHLPDGRLYGDNTDYFGFSCLVDSSGIRVAGRRAVVRRQCYGLRGAACDGRAERCRYFAPRRGQLSES